MTFAMEFAFGTPGPSPCPATEAIWNNVSPSAFGRLTPYLRRPKLERQWSFSARGRPRDIKQNMSDRGSDWPSGSAPEIRLPAETIDT
jgi:hypothetical protein